MARYKERRKILHQSDTKEYFRSIATMPKWSKILIENIDKPYNPFVQFLLEKNYYNDREERIMIKNIATEFGSDTSKISKWLKQIYEGIVELNFDKPELFKTDGIKHTLYCKYYDSHFSFTTWLMATPRIYEDFEFRFAQSTTGTSNFYVEKIKHSLEANEHNISIWLKGGFVNKYRELLLDRAEFYGVINLFDTFHKHDFEIDDELKWFYKY